MMLPYLKHWQRAKSNVTVALRLLTTSQLTCFHNMLIFNAGDFNGPGTVKSKDCISLLRALRIWACCEVV